MKNSVIDKDSPIGDMLHNLGIKNADPTDTKPKEAERIQEAKSEDPVDLPKKTEKIPAGYKPNPAYIETKSARFQLLLKPSTLKALKAYCKKNKTSVNDYVNRLLEEKLGE